VPRGGSAGRIPAAGTLVIVRAHAARGPPAHRGGARSFLTSVTHELKTPLAGIRLLAEMLGEGSRRRARSAPSTTPHARPRALRLSALIENVLDLGRIERGERGYDLRAQRPRRGRARGRRAVRPVARRDGSVSSRRRGSALRRARPRRVVAGVSTCSTTRASTPPRASGSSCASAGSASRSCATTAPASRADERERSSRSSARGAAQRDGACPGLGLGPAPRARRSRARTAASSSAERRGRAGRVLRAHAARARADRMTRVLLVEDDRTLRTGSADALASEGYDVTAAADGDDGARRAAGRQLRPASCST
jgi:hypothetical protein